MVFTIVLKVFLSCPVFIFNFVGHSCNSSRTTEADCITKANTSLWTDVSPFTWTSEHRNRLILFPFAECNENHMQQLNLALRLASKFIALICSTVAQAEHSVSIKQLLFHAAYEAKHCLFLNFNETITDVGMYSGNDSSQHIGFNSQTRFISLTL